MISSGFVLPIWCESSCKATAGQISVQSAMYVWLGKALNAQCTPACMCVHRVLLLVRTCIMYSCLHVLAQNTYACMYSISAECSCLFVPTQCSPICCTRTWYSCLYVRVCTRYFWPFVREQFCSVPSPWRPHIEDKRMVLEYTHGLFII